MPISISDAIEEYLCSKQNSITHKTYRFYSDFLDKFRLWCANQKPPINMVEEVKASHFQAFVASGETNNTYSRHHRAQVVKGFLNWCSQDDDFGVRSKMVSRLEMPLIVQSEIQILNDDEIKKLFQAAERMRQPKRNVAILSTLLDTGVRASELCVDVSRPEEETGLKFENVILGRGTESFIRVMGKGRKARTISLGQQSSLALRQYFNRERGHTPCIYAFLSIWGEDEPLTVRGLQRLLDEIGGRAGVEHVHPHRFRHTFAVNQLLSGTSDLVLMRLMGHSTLESTKIYVRAMTQIQAMKASVSVVDQMKRRRK